MASARLFHVGGERLLKKLSLLSRLAPMGKISNGEGNQLAVTRRCRRDSCFFLVLMNTGEFASH
jgi:hypothetical protein